MCRSNDHGGLKEKQYENIYELYDLICIIEI